MAYSVGSFLLIAFFKVVNIFIPWHWFPKYIGAINLLAMRDELREKNLYDTYPTAASQGTPEDVPMPDTKFLYIRNGDGKFNALDQPKMGCSYMRFGRNIPRKYTKAPTEHELLHPNPRIISERLLQRKEFKPATIVNLLAAAWIQFQVHDWLNHEASDQQVEIPLPEGDDWSDSSMKLYRTQRDKALDETDQKFPAYRNQNTPWWDASQIYGISEEKTRELRGNAENGKLHLDENKIVAFLPRDREGNPLTGFNNNWWLGLELMHTLFALEHNAICDMLYSKYSSFTNDQLFDTARLINCALMAKIHTVEWTPAILAHPTLEVAMNANWWGLLGEKLHKLIGRVSNSEVISGIPGSGAAQDNAPYSLTEEFTSVYRLHPLVPDNIAFFDVDDGEHKETLPILDVAFGNARKPMLEDGLSFADVFYSFGVNYPGAITIRNTPNFLRDLHIPHGGHVDMGVVDILRDRERGVPKYNQFRKLFHKKAVKSFEELAGGDKALAKEIEEIYEGDLENVDLLVGLLSEPVPKGFGFSDTAFRVFILMASRRIKSDRFLATEWKTEIYTPEGLDWVQNNGFTAVLTRHFPQLRGPLKDISNPFAPWTKIGKTADYKGVETTVS